MSHETVCQRKSLLVILKKYWELVTIMCLCLSRRPFLEGKLKWQTFICSCSLYLTILFSFLSLWGKVREICFEHFPKLHRNSTFRGREIDVPDYLNGIHEIWDTNASYSIDPLQTREWASYPFVNWNSKLAWQQKEQSQATTQNPFRRESHLRDPSHREAI